MQIELLYHTPLWVAAKAIRKCWASEGKSDTYFLEGEAYHEEHITHGGMCDTLGTGPKDKDLIERVGNKNKHKSTLEHLVYTFDIDGISRACLQELARHRHASLSVKSTRYTLKELKDNCSLYNSNPAEFTWRWDEIKKYVVLTGHNEIDSDIACALSSLKENIEDGVSNDISKYSLPEAYKTSLVWTINARSLQNFLELRTSKAALWEIRDLANQLYLNLPESHMYLFEECMYES